MVRRLVRQELTEKVAKAAVQSVGYDDFDDCLIWALSYSDDCEKLVQEFDNEIGKCSWYTISAKKVSQLIDDVCLSKNFNDALLYIYIVN